MKLPEAFLQSLEGVAGFEREAFVAVHERREGVTSVRVNPAKYHVSGMQLSAANSETIASSLQPTIADWRLLPVPWSQYGFYLEQRPSFTFDPLFHAGCYYVQEASSMFLEQAFRQLTDLSQPLKVLDLCASPGGKSTHIQSLLSADSLLVSNEVIKPRSLVLMDNSIKWGCSNVVVTNNDPKAFQKLAGVFDVLVVDAPCSGSGLFRKDEEAISEWSLYNVELCSQRQQRILADALPSLKEGGLLVYCTCSYSAKEDEDIMDWLVEEMGVENVGLNKDTFNGIVVSQSPRTHSTGYRFYPDKINGEGFFLACFRKTSGEAGARLRVSKPDNVSAKDRKILEQWVRSDGMEFLRFRENNIALPSTLTGDFCALQPLLNIQYAGVKVGQVLKERLVPDHALAQSGVLAKSLPFSELTYEDAIRYLQRQELSIQPETPGWQVVRYQNHPLGWINALQNRVNNYYPKEIRILKQNNTPFKK